VTDSADAAAIADELVEEAERYPAQRGEILLEAAAVYRRAGAFDRAEAILRELIQVGDEDGELAQIELAECRFDRGLDAEGMELLSQLRAARPASMACQLAAELLDEKGALEQALTWYNMAISRLTDEERSALYGEESYLSVGGHMVAARREIRARLGYPPDADDRIAPTYPADHGDLPAPFVIPGSYGAIRAVAERMGSAVTDAAVRQAHHDDQDAAGRGSAGPPPRNAPCWCGSGVKYKKCCGRPGARS
jgi:tetratricopeptide (TPR) repeat protein